MLSIHNLSYSYEKHRPILNHFNLDLKKGEILGITGPSGCGKSTLCHLILGLISPNAGDILLNNKNIFLWKKERMLNQKIQLVMQNAETAFDPNKTLQFSLREICKFKKSNKNKIDARELNARMESLLKLTQLKKEMLARRPDELSGGQLQRFSILRALLMNPELLILDEVTSMLDPLVQARIMNLLMELKDEFDLTYLILSHDVDLLHHYCNRCIYLKQEAV